MAIFHLKYRPKRVDELDLSEVSKKIKDIILSKESFQSILLAGPKGSGKTSAARILAKAVNCLESKNGEPCGVCDNCKEIEKGNCLDVIEIDAASNRGIDDVRTLKENAYLSPIKLKKKVFIIDEVHMLTKEAFNALLKLIEEPPKETLFVLCTTDTQKIPETVLSRLIKVDFRKGKKEELLASLEKIIKGEKIEIEEKAKEKIVENSDGSFRNLQRTFNEICLEYGDKISEENVEDYFKATKGNYPGEELEKDLESGDLKGVIDKIELMAEKGVDFGELRLDWVQYFHQRMLQNLGEKKYQKWIEVLVRAGELEKMVEIGQLPLELAVMEIGGEQKVSEKIVEEKKEEKKVESKIEEKKKEKIKLELEEVEKRWPEILLAVKPYNHSVEAFLRAARPKKIEKGKLIIEVFYKFHKEKLEEIKNKKIVETGLEKVFGGEIEFECVLGEVKKEREMPLEINKSEGQKVVSESEIYDIAKDIFG